MLGHCICLVYFVPIIFESIIIVEANLQNNETSKGDNSSTSNNDCNLNFNVDKFFENINNIDGKYVKVREAFHNLVGGKDFDNAIIETMVRQQGAAVRTVYQHAYEARSRIPAGINLGGQVLMRLERTVLFFYRMKLRDDTIFQVNSVQSDFKNMALNAELRLNELHLSGTFTNCLRRHKTTFFHDYYLQCKHKVGQADFFLNNVQYKLQGRYRLLQDKLQLEHIVSKLEIDYMGLNLNLQNGRRLSGDSNKLEEDVAWRSSLDEFLVRLKTDLDQWMLDYFNDYLMYFVWLGNNTEVTNFLKYDGEKTKVVNDFVDNTIDVITHRLRDIQQASPAIPDYTLTPTSKMTMLELVRGKIVGLDSMYRRSVATVSAGNDSREINAVIGFTNMKVFYTYECVRRTHPYIGLLVLTADDVTAHLSIKVQKSQKSQESNDYKQISVKLRVLETPKPKFLSIRGVGLLPPLKSLLENQVSSIMTETIVKTIKNLGAVAKCETKITIKPFTFDIKSTNNTLSDDEYAEDESGDEPSSDVKILRSPDNNDNDDYNNQNNNNNRNRNNFNANINRGNNNDQKSYLSFGFRLNL